ncbi:tetratricopeptide repeat protein [Patescibacteria group bacterium]|nr:tetratricopeptide repeat protein [Patescibacteria group bacterium]MBU1891097.1 tetratricopeptide repeat protein [Patescibacteria group bacterium]
MEVFQKRQSFSLKTFFKKETDTIFDVIIKWSVYLGVFLVPLFFLTTTRSPHELNKSLLFCLLTLIGVIAWLAKIAFKKGFNFRRTILDIPLVVYGLLYVLITIFSKNWFVSITGISNYYHHTLVVTLFLILFYFLVVNNFRSIKAISSLVITFLVSSFFVALISLLQIFEVYIFTSEFTQNIGFNPVFNSVTLLGLFLALALPMKLAYLVNFKKGAQKLIFGLFGILDFLVIFLLDMNVVWYVLIGGLFVLLLFLTLRSQSLESRWVILPTILLVLSAVLIFVDVADVTDKYLPEDLTLDHQTTWSIARSSLSSSALFGTGPEMFSSSFVEHRPDSFNLTDVWNLSFMKGSSEFLQILTTTGLISTVVYLFFLLKYGLTYLIRLIKDRGDNQPWFLKLTVLLPWLAIFVLMFFYPFSFVLSFVFWLFMALGASLMTKDQGDVIETRPAPAVGFVTSIAFSMLVVLGIVFIWGAATIWSADYNYIKGNQALAQDEFVESQERYDRAIQLNGKESIYYYSLANAYILQAQSISPKNEQDVETVNNLTINAQSVAVDGLNIDNDDVLAFQSYINIASSLSQYDPAYLSSIAQAYDELIKLDSNNPLHYINAGDNVILIQQQIIASIPEDDEEQAAQLREQANQLLNKAQEYYRKAVEVKNDYVDAGLKVGLIYELVGNVDQAITDIEKLAEAYPLRVDVLYELGRLYQDNDRSDEAKEIFISIVNVSPEHANANYRLGEIYQEEGDTDTAISLFARVFANNQDNELVRQKLEELGVTIKDESAVTEETVSE